MCMGRGLTLLTLMILYTLPGLNTSLHAQEALPPPPMPASAVSDTKSDEAAPPKKEEQEQITEPEVTIIHREEEIIEEYRVNGQLRYAKITPNRGPAYYLVDTDGDGILDTRNNDLDNPPINQWILWRW